MITVNGRDTETQVFFYEADHYYLSNFSAFQVKWSGRTFATSEHAYHWEKFITYGSNEMNTYRYDIAEKIRTAKSAHDALKLAERYREFRRTDWNELADNNRPVKVNVMKAILRAKVRQHEYISRKLLETGNRQLIEDSWRDDFWGWGPKRNGANWMGKLWSEIRAELRVFTQ